MSAVMQNNLVRAVSVAIALLYVVMGVALLADPTIWHILESFGWPSWPRYPLAILLTVYGCFRVYRAAKVRRFGDA